MTETSGIFTNTVPSKGQFKETEFVTFRLQDDAKIKVLFVGNSITRHAVAEQIGWLRDCGMAASSIEKDYVHLVTSALEKTYGPIDFCIAQAAEWERNYQRDAEILAEFQPAADFAADIVIIRIGENANRDGLDTADYADHFETMVKFFAGNAKEVIVTDLFWEYAPLEDAITMVCKRNPDYRFVSIHALGADARCRAYGEYEHTGVAAHPGDYGMQKIAEAILNAIG